MKKIYVLICMCIGMLTLSSQTIVTCSVSGNMLTIKNAANADIIMSPNTQALWQAYTTGEHPLPSLTPVISVQPVSNGCNIIYTFNNTSNAKFSLGKIKPSGIRFGQYVKKRDFSETGQEILYSHNNTTLTTNSNATYPKNLYSPIMVLNDTVKGYNLCLSLLYPILKYKHNTNIILDANNTTGGRNWTSSFWLNKYYNDSISYRAVGDLQPYETRTYTLCIRVITNSNVCESWQGGVQCYKDYFRSLYGTVKYTLDKRPINWYSIATQPCTVSNPYGFNSSPTTYARPDTAGYGPFVKYAINHNYGTLNYQRMIIVKPSGLHMKNPQLNFPFKFTSHWLEGNATLYPHSYGHKLKYAVDSLKLIPSANRDLGLCWGRSSQVMFDWDTNYVKQLDPYDPVCTAAGFKELHLAVKTGAKLIALDWFNSDCEQEKGYVWLNMMKDSAPGVKFYTEKWGSDILNTIAGMYCVDDTAGVPMHVSTPHYLADFLLPGVEKGVIVRNTEYPTPALRAARMTQLNNWGYVAMSNGDVLLNPYLAVESWYQTNPFPDLGMDTIICSTGIILNGQCKSSVSYTWSTGANTSSITVNIPGTYFVSVTNSDGCVFTDSIKLKSCSTSGINDLTTGNPVVSIYPNPFTNYTTLKVNTTETPLYSIILNNAYGQELRRVNNITDSEYILFKNDLSAGLYFISVYDKAQRISVEKIIVQ